MRSLASLVFTLFWLAVLVLVGGRFAALLVDANRNSDIVDRLYRHSDFWVSPFFNMFGFANKAVHETGGTFEPASFLAFIVYLLIGSLILSVLQGTLVRRLHV